LNGLAQGDLVVPGMRVQMIRLYGDFIRRALEND
jgi:hypothetical protein